MSITSDYVWLAGLFEGEGCITRSPTGVRLQIAMTDRDVIERVDTLFPMTNGIYHRSFVSERKDMYVWEITRAETVRKVLAAIGPHLGQRRTAKMHDALTYLDTRPGKNLGRRKTHCVHGHSLAGTNLYVIPKGSRRCRACHRRITKQAYRRKSETTLCQ